ncbi:helix-turn-helix domain-containing protein [Parerythrobacter jejuensis]|uniref:Helix-turn-helix domain-containing protein n=1 Tax=Parerythrobacter jejuensis TaxID=795812 RepID=A0A845AKJ5_9SPHN|nr:helix-turn-helix domain-containing protein [Parerythrobacter jejuensis]MXP30790.1 helix-turn-helix domain-containing protein [Parerythrobacter jejuensis]MXP33550.1 helix-turn-helix domain-containing protein [Parerythrobacter jejuensis]
MQNIAFDAPAVTIRFVMPGPQLAPFVTTLYHMQIGSVRDGYLEDWLHPEWANLRFRNQTPLEAGIGDSPLCSVPEVVMTGPTSMCTRFRARQGRFWGVGLLPLGWTKFCSANASDHRDRFCDATNDPKLAEIAAVGDGLFRADGDIHAEAEMLQRRLGRLLDRPVAGEDRISKVNAALVDPEVTSVSEFADHTAMTPRTLERLCKRVFGFPPKLLLRRQRFLRSLSRYMLDPSLSWISSLDHGYHDQAHFVRDFHRFMKMSPSAYSRLEHPILMAAMRGRMEAAGEAMQALHRPADA